VRDPQETPGWLDAWKPWLIVTIILIVLSYGWPLADLVRNADLSSAGLRALVKLRESRSSAHDKMRSGE
jgi:hypothetical protein